MLADLGATFEDLNWQALTENADRIFYFDAVVEVENGDPEELIANSRKKEEFLNALGRIDNFHVRRGLVRRRTSKRKSESPNQQKGVDIALAVEVMRQAMLGNMDHALLFTSDLDFFPVLEALIDTQASSKLLYIQEPPPELRDVADKAEKIGPFRLSGCLKHGLRTGVQVEAFSNQSDPWLVAANAPVHNWTTSLGGVSVWMREDAQRYVLNGPLSHGNSYHCASGSLELLIDHFEISSGSKINRSQPP